MRVPIQSEGDAFRSVVGLAALAAACLLLGYLTEPLLAIILACAALTVALGFTLARKPQRSSLSDAEATGSRDGNARRVLLIANETLTPRQLRLALFRPGQSRPALEVHAPVLQSRTHFVTTDIDRETAQARQRLRAILSAARSEGLVAEGHVGDPIDPVAGVEDELRRHRPDEVIIATHPTSVSWVESELLDRLTSELDNRVVHMVVGGARSGSRRRRALRPGARAHRARGTSQASDRADER
jgi:hypothetical protein